MAVTLLVQPQITIVPTGTPAWIVAIVAAHVAIMMKLSRQQLARHELSQHAPALVASMALVLLAATTLV